MRTLTVAVLLMLACSGSGSRPDCDALGERCHHAAESPNATATQRECHDKAHEGWSNAECLSQKASCEAVCPEGQDGG